MAKISPVAIKYIIHAKFEASGAIEKPDIIGALFGQTEGLLGEDLEMRELQKAGKIGRIEVSLDYSDGKTTGEIEVPSAMDRTDTSIIAAALETIERVGPSDTKITIEEIEDARGSKRDFIMERAKKLMERFGDSGDGFDNFNEELQSSLKASKIQTYGTENLPCGDISGNEIIIVEGRADVVNLLKKGVKNVIAMNGMKLPKTVSELSKEKTATLFVDGDRGGNLIIKNVTENADIDYITMAPEGKEVEELTGKEILQALRKKVKVGDYKMENKGRGVKNYNPERAEKVKKEIKKMSADEKEKIKEKVEDLIGTKGAIVFNDNLEVIKKVPVGRLGSLNPDEEPYVIAIDGSATQRIVEICEELGCSNLIATNFVPVDTDINLVSL